MAEGAREALKIEEVLQESGKYVGPTVGVSMLPMLRERRDTIVVLPKRERLKPLDVALYRRGEKYVLHRVLALTEDGYIIRGDNCYYNEYILEDAVFGVLTEFFRGDKHILCTDKKYVNYAKRRVKTFWIRKLFYSIKLKLAAIYRKIFKKK